eukprot:281877-Rhodomonas_salina.4
MSGTDIRNAFPRLANVPTGDQVTLFIVIGCHVTVIGLRTYAVLRQRMAVLLPTHRSIAHAVLRRARTGGTGVGGPGTNDVRVVLT